MFVRVFAVFLLWVAMLGDRTAVLAQDGILPNASQPTAAGKAPVFLMLTEQNPPFNYTNHETGAIVGASVELVREIMKRAGFLAAGIRLSTRRRQCLSLFHELYRRACAPF